MNSGSEFKEDLGHIRTVSPLSTAKWKIGFELDPPFCRFLMVSPLSTATWLGNVRSRVGILRLPDAAGRRMLLSNPPANEMRECYHETSRSLSAQAAKHQPSSPERQTPSSNHPGTATWVWLTIQQGKQTAGFGTHVSTYRSGLLAVLDFRFEFATA